MGGGGYLWIAVEKGGANHEKVESIAIDGEVIEVSDGNHKEDKNHYLKQRRHRMFLLCYLV